jgi:WD40 repeat protein
MLRSTGQLVLIDFGTARELTYTYLAEVGGAGSVTKISSAGYTPPEQEKGHAVPQSDFYALGRTFVYLLTGKQATDQEIYEPLTDTFNWRNYAPNISPKLANFIDKLMAPTAAARHKNTQEILDDLANISGEFSRFKLPPNLEDSTSNKPLLTIVPAPKKSEKPKKKWLVGAAVILVIGLGGYGAWELHRPDPPKAIGYEQLSIAKTITGHSSYVNTLAISPDGQTLVSGSADKTIKVWNLSIGQEILTLKSHLNPINTLVISPDGQTLVSGSADKTIKVWNLSTGQEVRTLKGHSNPVNSLIISSDWQTLLSGSADKTIKVWNLSTGQEIRTLTGNFSYVNTLAISPDGQTLASGSADKIIKIWNLSTGEEIRTLKGHDSYVNTLAISPDGQTLLSGSADKTIKVWNLSTGQEIRTLRGHDSWVKSLAISPDGQTLVSGSADNTIKIWNVSTGQEIRTLTGHSNHVNSLAISPDGQTIASGSGDNTIKIWRIPK